MHPQDLGLPLDLGHPERRIDASPGQATHPTAPARPLSVSGPRPFSPTPSTSYSDHVQRVVLSLWGIQQALRGCRARSTMRLSSVFFAVNDQGISGTDTFVLHILTSLLPRSYFTLYYIYASLQ